MTTSERNEAVYKVICETPGMRRVDICRKCNSMLGIDYWDAYNALLWLKRKGRITKSGVSMNSIYTPAR